MTKFIEITERSNNLPILINVDKIVSIRPLSSGSAYIELYNNGESNYCYSCKETYTAIYNELVACECVLFGSST